jgi:hypothetical protein
MKIKSVGLDLDNTLIDYTQAYFKIAEIFGITLVDLNKDSIKQHLTDYKNNDVEWQRFQSILYTKGLDYAELAPGLLNFLKFCKTKRVKVSVVSHKTLTTSKKFGNLNLRTPALKWLKEQQLIPTLISLEDIFFCPSKSLKIEKINQLKCDIFVDDLEEVLNDSNLNFDVKKVQFSNELKNNSISNFEELIEMLDN